jgi:hypothetical protein
VLSENSGFVLTSAGVGDAQAAGFSQGKLVVAEASRDGTLVHLDAPFFGEAVENRIAALAVKEEPGDYRSDRYVIPAYVSENLLVTVFHYQTS